MLKVIEGTRNRHQGDFASNSKGVSVTGNGRKFNASALFCGENRLRETAGEQDSRFSVNFRIAMSKQRRFSGNL